VVRRGGSRIDTIDLHHEDLPDPVVEMFRALQRRIDRIEGHCPSGPFPAEPDDPEAIVEEDDGSYSVEFEGWHWQI
jgi:hypothetical protein